MRTQRDQLEAEVMRALYEVARIGFPVAEPELIPPDVRNLPRLKAAQRKEPNPCVALASLLTDILDSLDETDFPDYGFYGYPDPRIAVRTLTDPVRRYFGLTPDTTGLEFEARKERADQRSPKSSVNTSTVIADVMEQVAAQICVGTTDGMVDARPVLPEIDELAAALNSVIKKGLPLTQERASSALLAFLPAAPYPENRSNRVARMNTYLFEQLEVFEDEELRLEARIYFAAAPGTKGTLVGTREDKIASVARKDKQTVRKTMRARIVSAFAWQLYRAKLKELSPGA